MMGLTISGSSGEIVLSSTSQNPLSITSSGVVTGVSYGVLGNVSFAWTVTNQGSISGTSKGVRLAAGGMVANNGTAARISGGDDGVNATGAATTVSNQGTIFGTIYSGVYLGAAGGAVTNSAGARIVGGHY